MLLSFIHQDTGDIFGQVNLSTAKYEQAAFLAIHPFNDALRVIAGEMLKL